MQMKEITYIFRSNLRIFIKGSISEMNSEVWSRYTQNNIHYLDRWQEPGWAIRVMKQMVTTKQWN